MSAYKKTAKNGQAQKKVLPDNSSQNRRNMKSSKKEKKPNRKNRKNSFVPVIFIYSLAIPILFQLGPLRLSPYRIILILAFLPLFIKWVTGGAGPIRKPDILMLLFSVWASVSLAVNHDLASALQTSGILLVETFGVYLLARVGIRTVDGFQGMVRALALVITFLLPFAIFESLTERPILLEMLQGIFRVYGNVPMQQRMGFDRAQAVFEHPILFGVVCSSVFALSFYSLASNSKSFSSRFYSVISVLGVASSLSVGAFVSIAIQISLLAWDVSTKQISRRWFILGTIVFVVYFVLDLLSNRSPFEVFISYLTFNHGNSYNRVLIWRFGTQEVLNHPIFGIGLNDWTRPYWMTASFDNFWLLITMRHGFPGFLSFASAFLLVCTGLGKLKIENATVQNCRKGILICLAGLTISACTVHFWNASYSLFIFLMGSGMWMLDNDNANQDCEAPEKKLKSHRRTISRIRKK